MVVQRGGGGVSSKKKVARKEVEPMVSVVQRRGVGEGPTVVPRGGTTSGSEKEGNRNQWYAKGVGGGGG